MSTILNGDINAALDLVHGKISNPCEFKKHAAVFLFGTENQEGINSIISYKDKDIATVASSGDQYLGAVYYGGRNIDIFDINRLTYYITCLKIAAIRVLDYRKFLDFLTPFENGMMKDTFFDLRTLKRLLPYLPSDIAMFWDIVMFEVKANGSCGDFLPLQDDKYAINYIQSGMPFYQSEEEYYQLQKLLRCREFPKFYEADIQNLKDVLTSSYDVLYLSNILECLVACECIKGYYPFMSSSFYLEQEYRNEKKMTQLVLDAVLPLLNEKGTILLSYRPNVCLEQDDWLYCNEYFDVHEVPSKLPPKNDCLRNETTDLVLTFRPKKKLDQF